jgi:hypothetical protein
VKSRPCISLFHFDYRPTKNVSLAQNSCEVNSLLFLCFVLITGHTHTHTHTHTHCFCSALLLLSCVWNCFLVFLSFLFPSTESQEVLTSWSATAGSKTSKQGSLIKFWLSSVFDIQWRETWYLVQKSFAL